MIIFFNIFTNESFTKYEKLFKMNKLYVQLFRYVEIDRKEMKYIYNI